jgi:sulfur carrier protein ThiS
VAEAAIAMRVRVLQLGRRVVDYAAQEGATVGVVLEQVGIGGPGMDVRVNGATAESTSVLHNDDVITVIPRIKGGRRPASSGWRSPG